MNIKKLNEELDKLILQERDRTFDNYDYDDLEEIVYSKYGAGYYILTKGKQYRVYEVFHEYYGTDISELGSFRTREKAINCICHCFDGDDITEVYDHGDIQFYDSDVENYALQHAYFGEYEEEQEQKKSKKTYETFAEWYGKDLTGQTYEGDIDCSETGLTSLEGAPQKVRGNFHCAFNELTSLEGAPAEVTGDLNCDYNKLTNLEGAPQYVGGYFTCNNNDLTSLKGAPKEVGGSFYFYSNKVTSLEFAPKEVGGSFNCHDNKLTSLKGAPQEVSGHFWCNKNNLTSLKGAPKYVGKSFDCTRNPYLKSLDGIGEVRGRIYSDLEK